MKNFSLKTRENSLLNSKERRKRTYLIWIVGAFVVLIFGKDIIGGITASLTSPFYTVRHYLDTSGATVPAFIRDREELLEQIRQLEQQVSSHQGVDATLGYIMEENNELRSLLQASTSPRIVAGVIARPPFTPYDTVIIDRGTRDGIVEHAPVYFGGGTAIGYVRKVFSEDALVTLFSSPEVESTVYVFGPNLFTTAYGEGGGVVRISIPQGIAIAEGDVVVLPSLDTGVLGVIDEVQSVSTEPEQRAYVTLSAPIQSIRLVSVGTRSIEPVSFADALTEIEEARATLFTIPIPEHARVSTTTHATSSTTSVIEVNSAP